MGRQFLRLAQVVLFRSTSDGDSRAGRAAAFGGFAGAGEEPAADAALRQLFAAVQRDLRRQLRGMLGNGADAEEIAQEACLRVWNRRHTIREDNPRGFLFRTATNLAIERQRSRQRRPTVADDDAILAFPDPLTPERLLLARLELEAVTQSLQSLPDLQRRILQMHREGFTAREIAAAVGCSPMTAWRHLRAGMTVLNEARKTALAVKRESSVPRKNSGGERRS